MPALAVFGITGRMGQALVRALREQAADDPAALRLTGALASAASARLGLDAAIDGSPLGVAVTSNAAEALRAATVAIDFSLPQGLADRTRACLDRGVPLLVGTTGIDRETRALLETAGREIPILIAANTSVGVAVLTHVLGQAARALGGGYDVEVLEAHHRLKRDAPSGTALALGEAVAQARGQSLAELAVFDPAAGPREPGSIGFASMRAGDIVGEHTVIFAAAGERVEFIHRATDRAVFARGALKAAHWLVGRAPGVYGMRHVLGL